MYSPLVAIQVVVHVKWLRREGTSSLLHTSGEGRGLKVDAAVCIRLENQPRHLHHQAWKSAGRLCLNEV